MISNETDKHYLESLRSKTRAQLQNAIGLDPQEIILLDVPRHRNLGDSLIWQGTLRYLEDLGHKVVLQSDLGRHRDSDLNRYSKSAIILLQGGGNMGDLYPEHDLFRQHIISTNRKRRIIVMPQSIYYKSKRNMAQSMHRYAQGQNTTILLREHKSMQIIQGINSFIDARFCYDAAIGTPIEKTMTSPNHGTLVLARDDQERVEVPSSQAMLNSDWSYDQANKILWKYNIGVGALYKRTPKVLQNIAFPLSQSATRRLLRLNVEAAVNQFKHHAPIATDRLHAHVLACLLGIPHVVTDNSYGKISSIYNEYSGNFSTAHWAASLEEAIEISSTMANSA